MDMISIKHKICMTSASFSNIQYECGFFGVVFLFKERRKSGCVCFKGIKDPITIGCCQRSTILIITINLFKSPAIFGIRIHDKLQDALSEGSSNSPPQHHRRMFCTKKLEFDNTPKNPFVTQKPIFVAYYGWWGKWSREKRSLHLRKPSHLLLMRETWY